VEGVEAVKSEAQKLKLTDRQRSLLQNLVRGSNENGRFGLGITSGPNGSIWPSLRKRGFVETVPVRCLCCAESGRSLDECARPGFAGRVTELGLEALKAASD
jgi:hypothetical protein